MLKGLFGKPNDKLQIGAKAPEFALTDLNGDLHRLSDYHGHFVVVNFWGTFCPPCREEIPALVRQYAEWSDQGVQLLGINLQADNEAAVERFVSSNAITYPILADQQDVVRKRYRVTEYPTTFFINPEGIITEIKKGAMEEAFIRKVITEGQAVH
jgi:peroxiredoxin